QVSHSDRKILRLVYLHRSRAIFAPLVYNCEADCLAPCAPGEIEINQNGSTSDSVFVRNVLPAFLPFRAPEQLRAYFNKARQHFENGYRSPLRALSGAESPTINFVGNVRVRAFLDDEVHQVE